ncbi:hypothetical protein [Schlesneria sp.]|uniref:hypothetical protein n=1 Tax=Schlesneria sp. TaxID=2762018 RepID=UPI002F1FA250
MTEPGTSSTKLPAPVGPISYTCPGELYSIPRSIHLARIAAFYSKCRDCPHRFDQGSTVPPPSQNLSSPAAEVRRPVVRTSLLTDESVRGVYLNELTRNRAIAWGEALAAMLWDDKPLIALPPDDGRSSVASDPQIPIGKPATRGPQVVVGFDERPSSPDIVTGVVLGLRRMGCPVIDLGQTGLTVLSFHLQQSGARAGLFVTGAGCDIAMTGFELLDQGGMPFSQSDLVRMESIVNTGIGRQTRQIGGHTPVHPHALYEASLTEHFHALRPLRVAFGTSSRQTQRTVKQIFTRLPCELTTIPLPTRKRDLLNPLDPDLQRIAKGVVEGRHHLGVVVDEDGQHCAFFTDQGRLVTVKEIARLLVEITQRDHPSAQFIMATSLISDARVWLTGRDATAVDGGESNSLLLRSLVDRQAAAAFSGDGRVWFRHEYVACDALIVLANILKALSLSDTPFSEVIDRISTAEGKSP